LAVIWNYMLHLVGCYLELYYDAGVYEYQTSDLYYFRISLEPPSGPRLQTTSF